MNKKKPRYAFHRFPASRQSTMDIGRLGLKKHHIRALIELDVTDSRSRLREMRNHSGEKLSFTAWLLSCIARACSEHRQAHALRRGKNGLVLFDDVDISLVVEKKYRGELVPLPLVIRGAQAKKVNEITAEIENAKNEQVHDESGLVLSGGRNALVMKFFLALPQRIRLLIWKLILANPVRTQKMMGTVVVTSVGMMGKVAGWIVPVSIHPLCFALGSIVKKPGVVKDKIAVREYLEMTVLLDHDVIDGAPAARFIARLSDLVENGFGLSETG